MTFDFLPSDMVCPRCDSNHTVQCWTGVGSTRIYWHSKCEDCGFEWEEELPTGRVENVCEWLRTNFSRGEVVAYVKLWFEEDLIPISRDEALLILGCRSAFKK